MSTVQTRQRPDPLRTVSQGCAWALLASVGALGVNLLWSPTFGANELGLSDGAYWVNTAFSYFGALQMAIILLLVVGVALNHAIADEPLTPIELGAVMVGFLWALVGAIFNIGAAWTVSSDSADGNDPAFSAFYSDNQGYNITLLCLALLISLVVLRVGLVLVTKPPAENDESDVGEDWQRAETVAVPPYDRPSQPNE